MDTPSCQRAELFCVNDSTSFEIAQKYAFWLRVVEEADLYGGDEYLAIPYQFEPPENYSWPPTPYEYYCASYEERKCGVCGESPDELYLRTSRTTVKHKEERLYTEVCEITCLHHIYKQSWHPNRAAGYCFGPNPEVHGKPVKRNHVLMEMWRLGVDWSPLTHRFFHLNDRKTVETLFLIAQRKRWPLPKEILWMILNHVFSLPYDHGVLGFPASYREFHYLSQNQLLEEDSCEE